VKKGKGRPKLTPEEREAKRARNAEALEVSRTAKEALRKVVVEGLKSLGPLERLRYFAAFLLPQATKALVEDSDERGQEMLKAMSALHPSSVRVFLAEIFAIEKIASAFAKHIEVEPERAKKLKCGHYGNVTGFRPDIGIRARSLTEANYARVLTARYGREAWLYESDRFTVKLRNGNMATYKPDFRITAPDGSVTFVEVKPFFPRGNPARSKMESFVKSYPDYKFVVLTKKRSKAVIDFATKLQEKYPQRVSIEYYETLEETYAKLLPEWETLSSLREQKKT
jgi:hypothetical protein